MNQKGLTISELLITTLLISILVVLLGQFYITGLRLFYDGNTLSNIRTDTARAITLIDKNLRQAKSIDAFNESSITFTADLGNGDESCRFYLYNADDTEPNPPYTQEAYELRWAQGTVAYGDGIILAENITPTNTPFSQSGNLFTIDLIASDREATIQLSSKVRPRNL